MGGWKRVLDRVSNISPPHQVWWKYHCKQIIFVYKRYGYLASVVCNNIVYALWKLLRRAQNLMLCESYCLCFWQGGCLNNSFHRLKRLFGNVVLIILVMLFKISRNAYGWKSVVKNCCLNIPTKHSLNVENCELK